MTVASIDERTTSSEGTSAPATKTSHREAPGDPPAISHWRRNLFQWYARRYLAKHLHGVRILKNGLPPSADRTGEDPLSGRPLVVVMNHPSWWDPLVAFHLSERFFPGYRHYCPMEAEALSGFGFFEKLGAFGIEKGTVNGLRTLLDVGERVLSHPRHALWITPQSRFADVRERPPKFARGLSTLMDRTGKNDWTRDRVVLPMALEYPFWDDRLPEALVAFGDLIEPDGSRSRDDWQTDLEAELVAVQDRLAAAATSRDPNRFETLIEGRSGVSGIYARWKQLTGSKQPTGTSRESGAKNR